MGSLSAAAERSGVVGFDVGAVATASLGQVIACGFLGYICAQPRWRDRLATRGL